MPQVPSIGEAAAFSPVELVQLLRPVGPVHPVAGAKPANSDSDRQPGQQARTVSAGGAVGSGEAADPQALEEAVEEINIFLMGVPTDLKFEIDDTLGRVIVSVVDSESGQVLRQLPGEEVLEVARRIREQAPAGLLDSMA